MHDNPRYRIDEAGILWQRVRSGTRTPMNGQRKLGRVVKIEPNSHAPHWRDVTYQPNWTPPRERVIEIHEDNLVDDRPPRAAALLGVVRTYLQQAWYA